jgi:hypothetical protein
MKRIKFMLLALTMLSAAPALLTSCQEDAPEINYTMNVTVNNDFSTVVDAINNGTLKSTEAIMKLADAIDKMDAGQQAKLQAVIDVLNSVSTTLDTKLAAIEAAIKAQTLSLESKLALLETAVKNQTLKQEEMAGKIATAIDNLQGDMAAKLAAIEDAVKAQTLSLEGKLALIEAAIQKSVADSSAGQELIQKAIEALTGTLEEKLAAIEAAIASQTTGLGAKLDLIEAALKAGFTDQKTALGEVKTALEALKGSVDGIDTAIDDIVDAIDRVTAAIDDTNDALNGAVADALADIFSAIDGLTDYSEILAAIKTAIENIEINGGPDTPGEEDGKINGYEYVEMGDVLKWATMNVGAKSETDYGDYFAWGETAAKESYTWATYEHMQEGQSDWKYITKYTFADSQTEGIWYDSEGKFIGDGKTSLKDYDYDDDAARQIWKGTWRIPTDAEWTALRNTDNFDWTWTDDYEGTGVAGRIVTSKVEGYAGNTIFLPAAGYRFGTTLGYAGSGGYYCSSSLYEYGSDLARSVYFFSEEVTRSSYYRLSGFSVRPVSE